MLSAEPRGRPDLRLKPTFSSVLLVIAAIGAAVILVQVFVAARRTLAWVFATALVAWVLSAIITLLDRWMPRAVALVITVIGVAGVGIGAWVGFGASVGAELADARKSLPPAAEKLERQSATARDFRLAARVRTLVGDLDERFGRGAAVSKAVGTAPAYVVTGVLMLFFVGYGPRYGSGALAQVADPQRRAFVASTMSRASDRARDYLLITLAQVFVVVVVSSTAFKVLGLPAPFGLGLMVGWFSVVPTLGIVLGGLPAMLLAGVRSEAAVFVAVVGLVLALQLVETIVVRRRVDERTVRVGPALSLIVALIGFQLYGFGGATYAFVALVLALAILDSWSAARATQVPGGTTEVPPPAQPADATASSSPT